ncbi:hypothetical protein NL676_007961 [Syzygium grande]|nr:hypothetical protein NL676_007961 [Syzygium grande]
MRTYISTHLSPRSVRAIAERQDRYRGSEPSSSSSARFAASSLLGISVAARIAGEDYQQDNGDFEGHLPVSGLEGLQELKKIAVRFEEKTYNTATSQPDYLRKISLKIEDSVMQPQIQRQSQPIPNSLAVDLPRALL